VNCANPTVFRLRTLGDHARPRLVHHLDLALLHDREHQRSVFAGNLVLGRESEPVDPELEAGLHGIHDEHRRETGERRSAGGLRG